MLLETYSMHIYNTYNKLQFLKEYVDDTEVATFASCDLTKQLAFCIRCMLLIHCMLHWLKCTEILRFVGLCQHRAGWPTQSVDQGKSGSDSAAFQQFLD